MTFLQRFWLIGPWREIARLQADVSDLMEANTDLATELAQAVDDLRASKTENASWIKTATRLRVERDQAKDALAKVGVGS